MHDANMLTMLTGNENCTFIACFQPGICYGSFIYGKHALSPNDCLESCQDDPQCNFFSFNDEDYCSLTRDCAFVDSSCSGVDKCVYGQRECEPHQEYVLIIAGYDSDYLDDVELIDVTTNQKSCPNKPSAFPVPMHSGMSLTYDKKPLICGGEIYPSTPISDCYIYDNDSWSQNVTLLTPRVSGTAVEVHPEQWLILGGDSDTSELFNEANGIFTPGPTLPNDLKGGVMLNETFLILVSGGTENYLLDVNTFVWTPIADRYTSNVDVATGIFFNGTIDEIQVAVLGTSDIEVYTPSTDTWSVLSNNGSFGSAITIQPSMKYFWLFLGTEMNRFDENGLSLIEADSMSISRNRFAASYMLKSQISCY